MNIRREKTRKVFSAGLSLLLLTLSVAVPLLERADLVHEPVIESAHNPAQCPPAHDHTVCAQASANLPVAGSGMMMALAFVVFDASEPTSTSEASSAAFPDGHPSRAPPLA